MKTLKFIGAVFALMVTFIVVSAMTNPIVAGATVGGLAIYSAAAHAGVFKGALFNAPPTIPDFIEKDFEELSEMTAKDLFEYRKKEHEYHSAVTEKAVYDAIQTLKNEMKDSDDTEKDALKAKIEEGQNRYEALKKEHIKFGLELKSMAEKGGSFRTDATNAYKELSENMEEIRKFARGGEGEIELKALVLRSAVQDDEGAVDLPSVGQYGRVRLSMFDLFPKIVLPDGTNQGTIRYYDWDEASTVEAAEMVAEGAAYPESTASWQKYTIDLKKVGDTIPVTEEFFEDEALFAAELRMFLMRNVEDIIDYQIAKGAGTGQNLTGLQTSATAFAPATVTHYDDPNIYDLFCAMKEQITKSRGSKYRPDFIAMNRSTINKVFGEKNADNDYIVHPLLSPDRSNFDGMQIVESNILDNDVIIIGDRRYGTIYHKPGIVLSKGYVDTQFTEDELTLKVRKRLLFLIRNVDQAGFVVVTDIDAALAAIDETS